jgi:lipopolysaccharide export system permease protein
MKILDWYIIKKYLSAVFFTLIMFSVIAVAIDASEKTDDFVKSGLTTYQILINYYIGFVPFIISMIFPLMVFIAVIFFTSKLAGRAEIVAIIAGGVPYNRFLRPYFIPKANVIRGNFQSRYIDNNNSYFTGMGRNNNFYLQADSVTFFGLRYYDTSAKSGSNFFLEKLSGNKVVYNLRAEVIRWDTATNNWRLENAIERKITGLKEDIKQIPSMNINLNMKPEELRRDRYLKDKLTTPQLKHFIHQEELRGREGLNEYRVERYKRDATPVSVVILTMIGVIIASRKTRGGLGLHLAMGFIIGTLFFGMNTFSAVFSTNADLNPIVAVWLPNVTFSLVGIWLYIRAPK